MGGDIIGEIKLGSERELYKYINHYVVVKREKEEQCEVGATVRGCSGSIGSDDTRGYGVGSGDVGKELPRGMIP